ncbi:hypothetical protein LZ31DRAFT_555347 [Colletotrichum somersetense]|nr:hypothetical protein LZ31DRAFT_555347 [Colletotrichum somersetense]
MLQNLFCLTHTPATARATVIIVLYGNLQLAWTISMRMILFGVANDVSRSLIAL